MNQLDIKCNHFSCSLNINNVKYLLGSNFSSKFKIFNMLDKFFNGSKLSEYSESQANDISVFWNGERLLKKSWEYYLLYPWINIDDDLKLGTKSIMLRYLDSILSEIEFEDTFQMLNQSIELLNQEYIAPVSSLQSHNISLDCIAKQFTCKSILKNLLAVLTIDELSADNYDLSDQDKLILYVKMVQRIARCKKEINHLLLIDSQAISKKLVNALNECNTSNLYVLISANYIKHEGIPVQSIALFGSRYIDLGNEEEIYENLALEHSITCSLSEYIDILQKDVAHYINDLTKISYLSDFI